MQKLNTGRRQFIRSASVGIAGLAIAGKIPSLLNDLVKPGDELFFKLALSQFSLASQFWTKQLDPLDFANKTKTKFAYCQFGSR